MTDHKKRDIQNKVQVQFGPNAQNYVTSPVHANAAELSLLLDAAQVTADMIVLDVATGGGHTALTFAPHVRHVVASDLTPPMLAAAEAFIAPQADNVTFQLADAEALPFDDQSFDVVTCRVAPHHFADIFAFVLESARVLKPGGVLVVQDHLAPQDQRAAYYLDAFERLRDPSHVKSYSETEWRNVFLDAQLSVEIVRTDITYRADFIPWVARMNVPAADVERLEIMLLQAPQAVKAWLQPRAIGTPDAYFTHRYILITGRKAEHING